MACLYIHICTQVQCHVYNYDQDAEYCKISQPRTHWDNLNSAVVSFVGLVGKQTLKTYIGLLFRGPTIGILSKINDLTS